MYDTYVTFLGPKTSDVYVGHLTDIYVTSFCLTYMSVKNTTDMSYFNRKSHILFLTTTGTRVGTFGLTKIEKILLAGGFSSGPS